MLRRLSIGLLASAVAIAPLPLKAQDGSAEDLGDVMSINLKDVVKPTFGFQGALQGAGTPNQALERRAKNHLYRKQNADYAKQYL